MCYCPCAFRQNGRARRFLQGNLHAVSRVCVLRQRIMMRGLVALAVLIVVGTVKLPVEHNLAALHRQEHFRGVEFNLDLREKIGQLGFIAALSGFRAVVADALFIQVYSAWENTEWGRMLLLFRHISTLQPGGLLFWATHAWRIALS